MKVFKKTVTFLLLAIFIGSCTPVELQSDNADTSAEVSVTGDGDNAGPDNDRDE